MHDKDINEKDNTKAYDKVTDSLDTSLVNWDDDGAHFSLFDI